jgi:hypothetical protein
MRDPFRMMSAKSSWQAHEFWIPGMLIDVKNSGSTQITVGHFGPASAV